MKRDWSSAAERARWLAELEAALDEAMILVERISANVRDRAERTELLELIEAARRKTRALRLRRRPPIETEPHPKWSGRPFDIASNGSRAD